VKNGARARVAGEPVDGVDPVAFRRAQDDQACIRGSTHFVNRSHTH
jgi:hypothetical protein